MRYFMVFAAVILAASAQARADDGYAPHNIRIDVEYRQSGQSEKSAGDLQLSSGSGSSYTKQFIVTMDGHPASILVGEQVPYVDFYRRYLFDRGYILEDEEMVIRDVGTKLKVEPRMIGNGMIEITLTPEVSFMLDRRRQVIDIKTLSTTIVAADGQSIPIGGLQQDADFDRCFFSTSDRNSLEIILTPHIQ